MVVSKCIFITLIDSNKPVVGDYNSVGVRYYAASVPILNCLSLKEVYIHNRMCVQFNIER